MIKVNIRAISIIVTLSTIWLDSVLCLHRVFALFDKVIDATPATAVLKPFHKLAAESGALVLLGRAHRLLVPARLGLETFLAKLALGFLVKLLHAILAEKLIAPTTRHLGICINACTTKATSVSP